MQNQILATDPNANVSVQASAGTGKTWMLITRILKLLLSDVEPGRLLALTFTRKAAAEMLSRLNEQARHWASADEKELKHILEQIGLKSNPQLIEKTRSLYEKLLHTAYPIRVSTFHAFAQDLLLRFPLEAEIPPGFELLNNGYEIEIEAWNRLQDNLQTEKNSASEKQLQYLFDQCGSAEGTKKLLNLFLNARIDWWAYIQNQSNGIEYARAQLEQLLLIKQFSSLSVNEYLQSFFDKQFTTLLKRLSTYLQRHNKANEKKRINNISIATSLNYDYQTRFSASCNALFKAGDSEPFKVSKTLETSIGETDLEDFYDVLAELIPQVEQARDLHERLKIYHLSFSWFQVGARYLAEFQKIKTERRVLDYSDLEWKAYQLLNHSNNAHWVQYKLDQRIDHLLVDEFQDTNPSQWHMLLPLLSEMATSQNELARSAFIVGDKKQSIYQFRRANPKLLDEASAWLTSNLNATSYQLASSRRSSPAIINLVNQVFENNSTLADFEKHTTHLSDLYGKVEILTVFSEPDNKPEPTQFRNPLIEARNSRDQDRYRLEADAVVAKIKEFINKKVSISSNNKIRAAQYSDILILMRKRTHVFFFEKALTVAKIPFIGVHGGALLDCLEVKDLCALLSILINPYDNLLLAQVLRSPIFNFTELELLDIAANASTSWYHFLDESTLVNSNSRYSTCFKQLKYWRQLAGSLPVHDLLDQLYFQSNIVARYEKVFPDALKPRLRANFAKFIDLALDMDSGRYPSVPRFIEYIKTLRQNPLDAPNSPPLLDESNRVRLLTVHSAKGLESPIVFLIDTCEQNTPNTSFKLCINWPSSQSAPSQFFTYPTNLKENSFVQRATAPQAEILKQEEANLLYVALTRAKQFLIISGSQGVRQKNLGWFGQISEALNTLNQNTESDSIYEFGTEPKITLNSNSIKSEISNVNIDWSTLLESQTQEFNFEEPPNSLDLKQEQVEIDYSSHQHVSAITAGDIAIDEEASLLGLLVHRILELKTSQKNSSEQQIKTQILADARLCCSSDEMSLAWKMAINTLNNKQFANYFDAKLYDQAYNEMPICFFKNKKWINGIIDRLVIAGNQIHIVDYKSHQFHRGEKAETVAQHYRDQLYNYRVGINKIWPSSNITSTILFTEIGEAYHFDDNE